jgi:biotin synthase
MLPSNLERILKDAVQGKTPSREDCVYLAKLPTESLETSMLLAAADGIGRRRFGNSAIILGQIGIDTAACPGDCGFCVFGKTHTTMAPNRLTLDDIRQRARDFAAGGDLFALFLMTMHDFEFTRLLEVIAAARHEVLSHTQIVVNIGDFDASQARQLRAAGVSGAYHVCRLREGTDTALDPAARKQTFRVIKDAGLDFYYCCEPIGPEHSAEEMVEQLFLGLDYGCFQHDAMRRVFVPGVPLGMKHGQVTDRRLAQIVAIVNLATLGCAGTRSIAVHEPNLLGLSAGANAVYAETGANPRDSQADTAVNRGMDVAACRRMLLDAGFTSLHRGDWKAVPLTFETVQTCATA